MEYNDYIRDKNDSFDEDYYTELMTLTVFDTLKT